MDRIVAILVLTAFPSTTLFAEEISWDSLPKLVKERNGRVSAQQDRAEAADALTGHTLRSFQPKLEAVGGYERAEQGSRSNYEQPYYGFEGRLNIFASGRDLQENKVREARAQIAKESARMSESEALFESRRLFLEWLLAHETAKSFEQAKAENEKGLKLASRRISRGVGTTTDRIEFELHAKDIEQEFESLKHEKLILQILLAGLLRFDSPEKLNLKGSLEHFHDEELLKNLSEVTEKSPAVKLSQASALETQALSSQSHRWWTPSVDLWAGHYLFTFRNREQSLLNERKETALGVELKFTLWDGNASNLAKSRSFTESAQRLESIQLGRDAQARVRAQQEDMKHAHEVLHLVEDKKALSGSYLRQSLSEYDRGVKQSPDVLLAFQRSLRLDEELIRARFNYRLAQAKLLKELGE